MNEHILTEQQIQDFGGYLAREERSRGTIQKYLRDLQSFAGFTDGEAVTKDQVLRWKESLRSRGYAAVTINSMLAAANTFFRYAGWEECRVSFLKIQRRPFRDPERELTREEYGRLLSAAHREGDRRLALLLETMVSTGVRVSELIYITAQAVRAGRVEVALKGKVRVILLPAKLCRKLQQYAREIGIRSGAIFRTRAGNPLSRGQIWAQMKRLCACARVAPAKVFPHNLRHLFAAVYYQACRDIVHLADLMGHSSIETTRIYLASSGAEQLMQLERLELVE